MRFLFDPEGLSPNVHLKKGGPVVSFEPEEMFTLQETADLLKVSVRTVKERIRAGALKAHDIRHPGGKLARYRIKASDLIAYQNRLTNTA